MATPGNDAVSPDHQLALVEMQKQLARYEEALARQQQAPADDDDDDGVIDLRELWNVLVRRRWAIFITMAVVLVAGVLVTAFTTPIYRATTVVQIELDSGNVLEFEDVTAEETASVSKDFYQTQYELLQSRALARRVIDQLGMQELAKAPDESVVGELLAEVSDLISGGKSPVEELPPDLETLFLQGLSIEPVRNSRLVKVHYESPDPRQSATIANAIAKAYVDMNLERRFEASTYAKSFLEDRIKQVRADLEDSERVLVQYTQSRGIVDQENKLGNLMSKLQTLSNEVVRAEAERIAAEAQYQEMLAASVDSLVQALDSQLIERLKEKRAEIQSEYKEASRIYKPSYPKMLQLQEQIDQINEDINTEVQAIRDGIQVKYQAKLREEAKLQESIAATKTEILDLTEATTDFATLKREVDTNRELYDGLLQRMKEVGVAAGIANNNISVVDAAEIPRGKHKPKVLLNIAIALVLGLFGGVALALLFETLDDSVKQASDLEKLTDKPVMGVIPKSEVGEFASVALASYLEPTSPMAEAYRSMRTALMLSSSEGAPKVLHFTSSSAGEGKTTSAVNTAINFALTGSRVLLIDGDLRNPSLHKIFNKPNDNGLTNYLTGDADPARVTQPSGVDGVFLMSSGPVPPNPAELLHGAKMVDLLALASSRFDYVVLDGPPLLGLADALLLADISKATLMVAAAHSARRGAVEAGLKRLRHSRANVLGTLLTKFDIQRSSYGYGYGYNYDYSYTYSYGAKPETEAG